MEKLQASEGETVELDKVMAISKDDGLTVGTPWIENAKVTATILNHGKKDKIIVFKYKPKKNYRKKQGHRQPYTQLKIEKIEG